MFLTAGRLFGVIVEIWFWHNFEGVSSELRRLSFKRRRRRKNASRVEKVEQKISESNVRRSNKKPEEIWDSNRKRLASLKVIICFGENVQLNFTQCTLPSHFALPSLKRVVCQCVKPINLFVRCTSHLVLPICQ